MKIGFAIVILSLAVAPTAFAQASADSDSNPPPPPAVKVPIANGLRQPPKPSDDATPLPDPHANDVLKQYPDQGAVAPPHDLYGNRLDKPATSTASDGKK